MGAWLGGVMGHYDARPKGRPRRYPRGAELASSSSATSMPSDVVNAAPEAAQRLLAKSGGAAA